MARIFYGWWVVVATSIIHTWGAGTFFYSFTAFFNPIIDEFGWSYTATSIAASLRVAEGGLASPLIGFAADRYGSRRLIIGGSILSGFGFILFSRISSLWSFYFVFILLSVSASLLFPIPGWTAVANWFAKKRGAALGILSGAIGAGGMLIYLINWLVEKYGWRSALVIVGIGFWVLTIPCAFFVRNKPESLNLLPDGEKPSGDATDHAKGSSGVPSRESEGFTLFQVLKTRAFWYLAAIVTISGAALHSVTVHIMPHFISMDLDRAKASLIASLLVLVSMLGRFGVGWLSGRINSKMLLASGLFMQALGLLVMIWADNFSKAMLFVVTFGPAYGALITLRLTVQGEYFGRKAYGAIQGFIMALMYLGTISGPVLTGLAYDYYKTYSPAWLVIAFLSLLGIPLALTMRQPPSPAG
jgi:sugar phosphate permease